MLPVFSHVDFPREPQRPVQEIKEAEAPPFSIFFDNDLSALPLRCYMHKHKGAVSAHSADAGPTLPASAASLNLAPMSASNSGSRAKKSSAEGIP